MGASLVGLLLGLLGIFIAAIVTLPRDLRTVHAACVCELLSDYGIRASMNVGVEEYAPASRPAGADVTNPDAAARTLDRSLRVLRQSKAQLENFSDEGAELTAWSARSKIRKLYVEFWTEVGQETITYYLDSDEYPFLVIDEQSSKVARPQMQRLYYDARGRLERCTEQRGKRFVPCQKPRAAVLDDLPLFIAGIHAGKREIMRP